MVLALNTAAPWPKMKSVSPSTRLPVKYARITTDALDAPTYSVSWWASRRGFSKWGKLAAQVRLTRC
jgi:hypothetical protein